jgi:hypothetical protein
MEREMNIYREYEYASGPEAEKKGGHYQFAHATDYDLFRT